MTWLVVGVGVGAFALLVAGAVAFRVVAARLPAEAIVARHPAWRGMSEDMQQAMAALLRDRDFAPLRAFLARDVEPGLRADRFASMKRPPPASVLQAWLQEHPDDSVALILLAEHTVHQAWDARGGGLADTVTEQGWRTFAEGLAVALQIVQRALENDPSDPEALRVLLIIARAAPDAGIDPLAVFHQATTSDPEHLGVHMHMARLLSERWGGSHAQLRDFAVGCSERAAPGSALHSLVARAHIDHWIHAFWLDDEPEVAAAVGKNEALRAEVVRAWEAFLPPSGRNAAEAYNAFAMWFWMADDKVRLADALSAIGDDYLASPWDETDPESRGAFNSARDEVGLPPVAHPPRR